MGVSRAAGLWTGAPCSHRAALPLSHAGIAKACLQRLHLNIQHKKASEGRAPAPAEPRTTPLWGQDRSTRQEQCRIPGGQSEPLSKSSALYNHPQVVQGGAEVGGASLTSQRPVCVSPAVLTQLLRGCSQSPKPGVNQCTHGGGREPRARSALLNARRTCRLSGVRFKERIRRANRIQAQG